MIFLKFCPQCGNAVDPDKKFCTHCGATLKPDLPGPDASASSPWSPPGQALSPARLPGIKSTSILAVAAVLVILILVVLFVGYPLLTGSSILSSAGKPVTPAPTPAVTAGPGSAVGGSYAIVGTEVPTLPPTTVPLIPATTLIPTTIIATVPTTVPVTKALFCPSDRVPCNDTCADLLTDNGNCGYCGTVCPTGKFCLNGNCMKSCTPGQTSCPDGCFDLQSDAKHCGTCLNACPRGLVCYYGQCTAPATPMPVPQ